MLAVLVAWAGFEPAIPLPWQVIGTIIEKDSGYDVTLYNAQSHPMGG